MRRAADRLVQSRRPADPHVGDNNVVHGARLAVGVGGGAVDVPHAGGLKLGDGSALLPDVFNGQDSGMPVPAHKRPRTDVLSRWQRFSSCRL